MMRALCTICIVVIVCSSHGCVYFRNKEGISTLRRLAKSQKDIETYLDKQVKLFAKLKADVVNNNLETGVSMADITTTYGQPIYSKPHLRDGQEGEVFYYRHPSEFYSTDWVHLYFDHHSRLLSWEFLPADK